MIQAGPEWSDGNPGHFVLAGREIDFRDSAEELDARALADRLVGRKVVASRLEDEFVFVRLDDGTHLGFQGGGQGGDGWLSVLAWQDVPPPL